MAKIILFIGIILMIVAFIIILLAFAIGHKAKIRKVTITHDLHLLEIGAVLYIISSIMTVCGAFCESELGQTIISFMCS